MPERHLFGLLFSTRDRRLVAVGPMSMIGDGEHFVVLARSGGDVIVHHGSPDLEFHPLCPPSLN